MKTIIKVVTVSICAILSVSGFLLLQPLWAWLLCHLLTGFSAFAIWLDPDSYRFFKNWSMTKTLVFCMCLGFGLIALAAIIGSKSLPERSSQMHFPAFLVLGLGLTAGSFAIVTLAGGMIKNDRMWTDAKIAVHQVGAVFLRSCADTGIASNPQVAFRK